MSDVLLEEELVSNITDEINFVETDAEVIAGDLISRFEEYLGETLYAGDERRIFLQGIAYVIADQLIHINETGRSNMLRYAKDNELDELGELYNNERMKATYATTILKFRISQAQSVDIVIPKGTRVTPDGKVFFATDDVLVFPANTTELEQEISATATESGADHNDFGIGSINKIVDTIAYVAGVSNTTTSDGGNDKESDDDYRERMRLAPFTFSIAGAANAYKAIALSATSEVGDVSVYSPSAGVVEIAVTKDGGEIPESDDAILTTILEACSADDVRPLTDNVRVVPASAVDVNINVTYYISNNDTSKKEAIESAVEEYRTWQTETLGRDINPDKLNSLMFGAGAARVTVTEPVYQALEKNQIARFGTVTVTYGGSVSM